MLKLILLFMCDTMHIEWIVFENFWKIVLSCLMKYKFFFNDKIAIKRSSIWPWININLKCLTIQHFFKWACWKIYQQKFINRLNNIEKWITNNTNEHVKKRLINLSISISKNLQWDAQKFYCHCMKTNLHKTFLK